VNRRFRVNRVLVGTLLIPTIFGALVLWSLADRTEQSDRVPAAVVNLDKPVTQGHGKDEQIIYAGRLLAGGLTSPKHPSDSSLGWQLTNADDAEQGLRNGDYYAVVTIPRDFSRTLAGISGRNPRAASVIVQSNDSSSALAGEVSHRVTDVAAERLGHRITATFLKGLAGKTGELKGKLGQAADGATRIADGVGAVRSGAAQLDQGAGSLAGGLWTLGSGADRLAGGADKLHDGASRLASGVGRLDGGAHRLASGLGTLADRTAAMPRQTRRLADGAHQVSGGVGPYTQVVKAWAQACATQPAVAATNPQLCAGTIKAAGPAGRNADKLANGARQVAAGTGALADQTPRLTSAIHDAARGAGRLATGAGKLATGVQRLSAGSARLSSGAGDLADGAHQAGAGADRLAGGSKKLSHGAARLSDGSRTLAAGLQKGAAKIPGQNRADQQAEVVADPVATTAASLNPVRDGATLLVPAVLAFALWLGAFVTYLVRQALPERRLRTAAPGWRLALAGWLPALAVGAAQSAALFATVELLGADLASPVAVAAFMLASAAVFTALNQAFVALLGPRRGWIVSIAFAVLQAVSLGGLVPIDTAPGPLQALNKVLPVSRAADGFNQLALGGQVGSPGADLLVLALWGFAALVVTAFAARRRQRIDLGDLRREADAVPVG
jgi:putative membrane protein